MNLQLHVWCRIPKQAERKQSWKSLCKFPIQAIMVCLSGGYETRARRWLQWVWRNSMGGEKAKLKDRLLRAQAPLEGFCHAMRSEQWLSIRSMDGPGLWEAAARSVSTTFFNYALCQDPAERALYHGTSRLLTQSAINRLSWSFGRVGTIQHFRP